MKRSLFLATLIASAILSHGAFGQDTPPPPPPPPPGPDAAPAPAPAPPSGGESAPKAAGKATLAVMPFNFTEAVRETKDGVTATYVKEFETKALTNKFITELVNTRKFDVVEREKLDKLIQEMQFGESGMVDPNSAAKAGKVLGVDYFLMGQISVFAVTVKHTEIPYVQGKWKQTIKAQIIVDMRIVDTRTSKIVAAEKGDSVLEGSRTVDSVEHVTVDPATLDTLQRNLCSALTLKVIDAIYPIKVIGYTNGVAFLNRGIGGGLKVGDVVDVFVTGEEMVDPDTGAVLGNTESKVGQLKIIDVQAKFTKATPYGSAITAIPKEAICRICAQASAAPPPPPAKKGPKGW